MVKEITIRLLVTLKEFNMFKEKLKELLSIPTKTWEEERLINYLIGHILKKWDMIMKKMIWEICM